MQLTAQNRSPSSDEMNNALVVDHSRKNRHRRHWPPPAFSFFSGQFQPLLPAVAARDHCHLHQTYVNFYVPLSAPPHRRLLDPTRTTPHSIGLSSQSNFGHLRPPTSFRPPRGRHPPTNQSQHLPVVVQPPPSFRAPVCRRSLGAFRLE